MDDTLVSVLVVRTAPRHDLLAATLRRADFGVVEKVGLDACARIVRYWAPDIVLVDGRTDVEATEEDVAKGTITTLTAAGLRAPVVLLVRRRRAAAGQNSGDRPPDPRFAGMASSYRELVTLLRRIHRPATDIP